MTAGLLPAFRDRFRWSVYGGSAMRRYLAGTLVLLMISQSSGVALAHTRGPSTHPFDLAALIAPLESALTSSLLFAVVTGSADRYAAMHAPPPAMQRPQTKLNAAELMRAHQALQPRIRAGVRHPVALPPRSALDPRHLARDPLAMRPSLRKRDQLPSLLNSATTSAPSPVSAASDVLQPLRVLAAPAGAHGAHPISPQRRSPIKPLITSTAGTGIEHWWTYEESAIPGIGKAMANVGTGNLLLSAMDVDVPEQGINLAFQRVYNSQSLHDANGDDGGDPAIFGNGWTNNFDASIVYSGGGANTITVYDIDGAACTYTSNGNGTWVPCTGEYATLAPVSGSGGCAYDWIKPNGTIYVFYTDGSNGFGFNCPGISQAQHGHLEAIYSRNLNSYISFTYSYNGSGKTSEDITEIDANHSDGDTLKMIFGVIPGTSINELKEIQRPDGADLNYWYDNNGNGNLVEVDKPGNNSASNLPGNPHTGGTWQQGDLPETYAYSGAYQMEEACGPRCTAAMWANPNSPNNGAAVVFAFLNSQLTEWQVQGVLNFTPDDQTGIQLQVTPPTGWQQWNTTTFQYGSSGLCGSANNNTTYMCDHDGHATKWTTDSSGRVTQTNRFAVNQWIVTSQAWDNSNNLISTTDANSNITQYGYDGSGNMVEMQLPNATDFTIGGSQGQSLMPLSFYSYDSNNNVLSYCDPYWTNKNHQSWQTNPPDNLCPSAQGTTYLAYNYDQTNEPYGCLTDMYKPGGYHTAITYTGATCGVGLPSKVQGDIIPQFIGEPSRRPTQDFVYNTYGQLTNYDRGQDGSNYFDSWTLSYNQNGNHDNLNTERTENDASISGNKIKSFTCYYPDGSVFYTETPSQHDTDGNLLCPTTSSLLQGSDTPPAEATAHYYDYDGDEVKSVSYKGCSSNNSCASTNTGKTRCSSNESAQPIGTTCKYYDGLDRLVETAQPYDDRSFSDSKNYEFYAFRWMNRYIYDLSLSGSQGSLTISDLTGMTASFAAYGNLYKTQEYLSQFSNMHGCSANTNDCQKPNNGQYSSASWSDERGTSFDSLDRPISKYELAFGHGAVTTNSYDASGQAGQLSSVVNAVGQTITYVYDAIARIQATSFSSGDGDNRSYSYDPDGRAASITANSFGQLSYTYDVDGNELSITEPTENGGQCTYTGCSLICYSYYGDGLREYLSIGNANLGVGQCGAINPIANPANGGISQPNIFSYAYTGDGRLMELDVNWGTNIKKFSWTYTPNGRELSETDPLSGSDASLPYSSTKIHLYPKTYTYGTYGRVNGLTLPDQAFQQSNLVYDEDDELAGYTAGTGQGITRTMILNARGEMIQDGTPGDIAGIGAAQGETQSGNGALVGNGDHTSGQNAYQLPPTTVEYDLRSNMVTCSTDPNYAQDWGSGTVFPYVSAYDAAGRQAKTGFDSKDGFNNTNCDPGQAQNVSTYDAENHIQSSFIYQSIYQTSGTATWGPDGRQRISVIQGQFGNTNETAHWDGDSLLFATGGNNTPQLYIGKLGVMDYAGDIDVYDRDQTGAKASSHGFATGTTGVWVDGWSAGSVRTVQAYKSGNQYPLQFFTGSCNAYFSVGGSMIYVSCPGVAAKFEMTRADGYEMVGGIVQGARTYDSTTGQWLTPDPYAGDVDDPMSQKPFMWNNNNPASYADITGYNAEFVGSVGANVQSLFTDWSLTGTVGIDTATFDQVTTEVAIGKPNPSQSPLQTMRDAAAESYLSGPLLPSGGIKRPGTQSVSELVENAAAYLAKAGVETTERSISGLPALLASFADGQTGAMAFSMKVIQIFLNDTAGNEITKDYTEVRWHQEAGGYGHMFTGGYPEWRQPFAEIPTWLPVDMHQDIEQRQ
jgi:YD repeat-containing protein